jgi:hypothetical protein
MKQESRKNEQQRQQKKAFPEQSALLVTFAGVLMKMFLWSMSVGFVQGKCTSDAVPIYL